MSARARAVAKTHTGHTALTSRAAGAGEAGQVEAVMMEAVALKAARAASVPQYSRPRQ